MQEKAMKEKEQKAKEYEQYVKQVTPTHSLPMNMAKAFFVGGLICVIGQAIFCLLYTSPSPRDRG